MPMGPLKSMGPRVIVPPCPPRLGGPVRGSHILKDYMRESLNTFPNQFETKKSQQKVLPRQNCKAKTPLNQLECDSAIGLHLLQNADCAAQLL